jgi:hypothetical protein
LLAGEIDRFTPETERLIGTAHQWLLTLAAALRRRGHEVSAEP